MMQSDLGPLRHPQVTVSGLPAHDEKGASAHRRVPLMVAWPQFVGANRSARLIGSDDSIEGVL